MPSLSDAMELATTGLYKTGDVVENILTAFQRVMPKRRFPQPYDALLKGALWIAATVLIDTWAGHPSILQLLYLAPLWLAYETAGVGVAACLAAAIVPVSTVMSPIAPWGQAWDVVVRSALMASLIVIMAHHGRRYSTTRESAKRDALTGAFNRAGFEDAARIAIDKALAGRTDLSLAVIDCDKFKDLNDLKGHAYGDQVLRTLVRTLNTALEGAIIGRTGGDEFVVIDSQRDAHELRRAIARAQERFSDATLIMGRQSSYTVGIAQLGPEGMRYESLVEAADRDMYRGKVDRSRAVVSTPRSHASV